MKYKKNLSVIIEYNSEIKGIRLFLFIIIDNIVRVSGGYLFDEFYILDLDRDDLRIC